MGGGVGKRVFREPPDPARVKALRDGGMTLWEIGNYLGCGYYYARGSQDPEWLARHKEKQAKHNATRREREAAGKAAMRQAAIDNQHRVETYKPKPKEELPAIPADTRSLTARLMGDPLPGRSFLDMKKAKQ
jgi:hypothetical protein